MGLGQHIGKLNAIADSLSRGDSLLAERDAVRGDGAMALADGYNKSSAKRAPSGELKTRYREVRSKMRSLEGQTMGRFTPMWESLNDEMLIIIGALRDRNEDDVS